jgi:DNA repair protein RadC
MRFQEKPRESALNDNSEFYNRVTEYPESVRDTEVIEMLLSYEMTKEAACGVAKRLIENFGSFANVISADQNALMCIAGLTLHNIAHLKLARIAALRLLEGELKHRDILNSWNLLFDYLIADLARAHVENVRGLFFDEKYGLISSDLLMTGTIRYVSIQPRTIVKRALDLHASYVIIAHNHPSGDPTPSVEDLRTTKYLKNSLSLMDLTLLDHIIIGNGVHISLRDLDWISDPPERNSSATIHTSGLRTPPQAERCARLAF